MIGELTGEIEAILASILVGGEIAGQMPKLELSLAPAQQFAVAGGGSLAAGGGTIAIDVAGPGAGLGIGGSMAMTAHDEGKGGTKPQEPAAAKETKAPDVKKAGTGETRYKATFSKDTIKFEDVHRGADVPSGQMGRHMARELVQQHGADRMARVNQVAYYDIAEPTTVAALKGAKPEALGTTFANTTLGRTTADFAAELGKTVDWANARILAANPEGTQFMAALPLK
jgi:hypothetical protein